ncbi:MAG: GNAT family N-acetyltransferase [Planctomycetota bacterium]
MSEAVSADDCEIRGIESREEVEAVADLYGKAFEGYGWHYHNYTDLLFHRVPRKQWRLSRALWAPEGTPVAHVRVCDRTMRLGAAQVRVGGIGDVCTHPFHRKRGLMRHLFAHVVAFMAAEGYPLSILWGIGEFYDKFGFIACLPGGTLQMPRRQAARLDGPYGGRKASEADVDALVRLHRDDYAVRDGAMKRPGRQWAERALSEKFLRVLTDGRGRARAAYWAKPEGDALVLREVSLGKGPDRAGVVSVLADMVKLARRCEKPNLRFELPPEHPIGRFARADGCQVRRYYGHRGDGMARIIDLMAICETMAPEWTRLLAASPVASWQGRLRLATDLGQTDLVIADGQLHPADPSGDADATLRADQDALTRLLLGFHTPATARFLRAIQSDDAALPLLTALFPRRAVHVFPADRF